MNNKKPKYYMMNYNVSGETVGVLGYTTDFNVVRWCMRNLSLDIEVVEYDTYEDIIDDESNDPAHQIYQQLESLYSETGYPYPPMYEEDDVMIDYYYDEFVYIMKNMIPNLLLVANTCMKRGEFVDILSRVLNHMQWIVDLSTIPAIKREEEVDDYINIIAVSARVLLTDDRKGEYYYGEY